LFGGSNINNSIRFCRIRVYKAKSTPTQYPASISQPNKPDYINIRLGIINQNQTIAYSINKNNQNKKSRRKKIPFLKRIIKAKKNQTRISLLPKKASKSLRKA
jgi:hypothetical protein